MVEAAAVLAVVAAASVGTNLGVRLVGILEFNAAHSLVVTDGTIPVGTVLAAAASVGTSHLPSSAHRATTVGIVVVDPRQRRGVNTAEVHGCDKLRSCGNAVVHVSEEVVALV